MKNILKFLTLCLVFLAIACSKDEPVVTPTPTPTPTPTVTKSSAKDITKFSFAALSPAVDATIDATNKTISATVPAATDVTKLVPTITLSDKATVSPATGVVQDFSKEVSYTITAEDASTVVYKVTIVVTPKSSAKNILTLSFNATSPAVKGIVDTTAKKVSVLLPVGTDLTKLVPTFTFSNKATVLPASGVKQDFSKDVNYTVTAEDGTTKVFTVKAVTDAYYYSNIRMTIGENKGFISELDSNLLNYRTGKVYQLKDGAKNAANIDLVLNNYCNLSLSPPIVLKNCGVSCGLGRLNDFVKPQNWSIYRVGDIDLVDKNEIKAGSYGYGQIAASDWNNLSFAADIDASLTIGRKLDSNKVDNISQSTLVNTNLSCVLTTLFNKVLYRFISHEGKKGVLRVTSWGKKPSGGYFVLIDIKIQK
jgi:Domain of unknown function (DUF5018)